MLILLVNLYPTTTMARYLLSSYVLKAYLSEYYKNPDLKIEILNIRDTIEIENAVERIRNIKPDLIGYSCYVWNFEKILKIINILKTKIKVLHILGGPEITFEKIKSLKISHLDNFYVIGEGERKFLKLIQYLEKDSNIREFPKGIVYYKEGSFFYEKDYEVIENLDEIPSIYLNKIIEDRFYAQQQAFLETQRGCIFRCKYCVYPKSNPKITYYSLERVIKEIEYLIIDKKITALRIFDAIFTSNLERAKIIVEFLLKLKIREKVQLPWIYWEYNYFTVDDEYLQLLSKLKNKEYILNSDELIPIDKPQHYSEMVKDYIALNSIGIQSFQNKVLKAIGRPGIDRKTFETFMNKINKYNLILKVDLILGLPYETIETFFEGIEYFLSFLRNTDHILNIHLLEILPGSNLEELCGTFKIKYSQNSPHRIFSTNTMDEKQMQKALKLTAILFRIVNSPLRKYLFDLKEKSNSRFMDIINILFDEMKSDINLKNTKLFIDTSIDDEYWNEGIFSEIPTTWLIKVFKNHIENGIGNEGFNDGRFKL